MQKLVKCRRPRAAPLKRPERHGILRFLSYLLFQGPGPPNSCGAFLALSPARPITESGGSKTIFDWAAVHFVRVRLTGVIRLSEAVVKSPKNARIRSNLHRGLCFCGARGFAEIGFARPIFAYFAAPA